MLLGQTILNLTTVFTFCAMLGLVWSYFLLTHKRGNLAANRYLSILIAALAVILIRQKASIDSHPIFTWLYFISQGVIFLIGPALYLHVTRLIHPKLKSGSAAWLHFIPALISIIFMSVLFAYRFRIKSFNNLTLLKFLFFGFTLLQIIHLLTYVFLAKKKIKNHQSNLNKYTSTLIRINASWVRNLAIIASLFSVLIVAMYALIISGGYYEINNSADKLYLILLSIIVITIIIKSWRQPEVVSGYYEDAEKYKTSRLKDTDVDRIKEKLSILIEEEQFFLQPELSVQQLAEKLELPAHNLSQIINQEYQLNFFHFINELRINYAVAQLKKGAHKGTTLEGIAYDSGFNSKSTFNRAFKRKLGCSPKQFCDSLE